MARLRTAPTASDHTILVVDDDTTLAQTTAQLLAQDGHEVLVASNGPDAIELCRTRETHLILLDYAMPGMTGEDVVRAVRTFDTDVQIVLHTGYATDRPARQMLRDLDIQGYHDKSEGPAKLLVWVDAALKAYRRTRALRASRDGLDHILRVTPQLHRYQPLDDLMRGMLVQILGLLGYRSGFVATRPEPAAAQGFVATLEAERLHVRVGTGRFDGTGWQDLEPGEQHVAQHAVRSGHPASGPLLALPLVAGDRVLGVVGIDADATPGADLHLLEVFANQAAIAIENVRLYELATIDDLTRLSVKRAWLARLDETLHLARRHGQPTSVLLLDIDHFKTLNDTHGHLAGDAVLAALGRVLHEQVRASDLSGRYGGEELGVVLPCTDLPGAKIIASRIRDAVERLRVPWDDTQLHVTVSVGASTVAAFHDTRELTVEQLRVTLLRAADEALYAAKALGRNRVEDAGARRNQPDDRVSRA